MAEEPAPDKSDSLGVVGVLGEPNRRALYEFICSQDDWVSRDQAADAVGLLRATAAHHLDRLAAEGLLDIAFRRLSGRQGPGAGRPAKIYRRSARRFQVSLPPRDFELVGGLLAEAVERARAESRDVAATLDEVARDAGRNLAQEMSAESEGTATTRSAVRRRAVLEALGNHGYEPAVEPDGTVVLRNCPFHELARTHRELVCGMNHELLDSALGALGGTGLRARLQPEETTCCVRLVEDGSSFPA